jgi:hypothetical protein
MYKSELKTDKYKLNRSTVVTVKNVPKIDRETGQPDGYEAQVTLKHTARRPEPLSFEDQEQLETFIGNIDLDDEQQAMALDDK